MAPKKKGGAKAAAKDAGKKAAKEAAKEVAKEAATEVVKDTVKETPEEKARGAVSNVELSAEPSSTAQPQVVEQADAAMKDSGNDRAGMPVESEQATEPEVDARPDNRKQLAPGSISWNLSDATLNAMTTPNGRVLMTLQDGGMQYLLAGIRANVGIKAGRYFFETRIVESISPCEPHSAGRTPMPKQLFKLGFSLAESSFISDSNESFSFDSEGFYVCGKKKTRVGQRTLRDQTVGVLLNLDQTSASKNTVSFFRNGARACEPQPIPDSLIGKTLFPTVVYKNMTLQVNFGPTPKCPLPFVCPMLANAAEADTEAAKDTRPKDGKYEVVFPMALPDQGGFDWLDGFLEKNPSFVELSDRYIIDWATKSGLWKPRPTGSAGASNDKPQFNYGIPLMDDSSIRKVINNLAPTLRRNFVVTEVRSNLIADDRKAALRRFSHPDFKKIAMVMVGKPDEKYLVHTHEKLLAEKVAKAEAEKKRKSLEKERKRLLEEKSKQIQEARAARLAEEARRAGEAAEGESAPADGEGTEAKGEPNATGEDEEKGEEKEEEEKAEKKEEKKEEEDDVAESEGPVELTEEEKQQWHRKSEISDLTPAALSRSFTHFSLPTDGDGFDEVRFVWQPRAKAAEHLHAWVLNLKKTQKAEDLQPGQWFKDEIAKWSKLLGDWKARCSDWNDPRKKELLKKKQKDAQKADDKDGDDAKAVDGEPDAKPDGEPDKEPDAEEPEPAMEIDADDVDPMGVEDVSDIGSGEPLYARWSYEDWALCQAAYELHLLLHAFRTDLDDPDRPSFTEEHMPFYYTKYFRKTFVHRCYGVETCAAFLDLVAGAVKIGDDGLLCPKQPADAPQELFVRLAEEDRRERDRRIDAGDETARLKFSRELSRPAYSPAGYSGSAGSEGSAVTGPRPGGYHNVRGSMGTRTGPRSGPRHDQSRFDGMMTGGKGQKRQFSGGPGTYPASKMGRPGKGYTPVKGGSKGGAFVNAGYGR